MYILPIIDIIDQLYIIINISIYIYILYKQIDR